MKRTSRRQWWGYKIKTGHFRGALDTTHALCQYFGESSLCSADVPQPHSSYACMGPGESAASLHPRPPTLGDLSTNAFGRMLLLSFLVIDSETNTATLASGAHENSASEGVLAMG